MSSTRPRLDEENRSLIDESGEREILSLSAPGENERGHGQEAVEIAVVDELAESFARVDLSV
jgi:hypothetical protein